MLFVMQEGSGKISLRKLQAYASKHGGETLTLEDLKGKRGAGIDQSTCCWHAHAQKHGREGGSVCSVPSREGLHICGRRWSKAVRMLQCTCQRVCLVQTLSGCVCCMAAGLFKDFKPSNENFINQQVRVVDLAAASVTGSHIS